MQPKEGPGPGAGKSAGAWSRREEGMEDRENRKMRG